MRNRKVSIAERRGRFVVDYRDDSGRRVRDSFETRAAAEREKERIELAFRGFVSIARPQKMKVEAPQAKRVSITVKEAIRKYSEIAGARHVSSTKKVEKSHFGDLFVWLTNLKGIVELADVRLVDLEEFQSDLLSGKCRRKPLKGSSVNRMFATYASFFAKAKAWDWIEVNPCAELRDAPEAPPRIKPWTKEQIHIAQCSLPIWASEMECFLSMTGRRPVDAERMNWSDVDFEGRRFRSVTLKGGAPFESWFPMADQLFEFFKAKKERARRAFKARDDDPVFFNSKGIRATGAALYQAFCEVRENEVSLKGLTPYGLRHGFITGLVDRGVHPRDIQILAGHKKFDTTIRYTHRKQDHLRAIVTDAATESGVMA